MRPETLLIDEDANVTTVGVEAGPRRLFGYQSPNTIVVHEAGSHYWSAIGRQSYAPAEWRVYRILNASQAPTGDGLILEAELLATIPVLTNPTVRHEAAEATLDRLVRNLGAIK